LLARTRSTTSRTAGDRRYQQESCSKSARADTEYCSAHGGQAGQALRGGGLLQSFELQTTCSLNYVCSATLGGLNRRLEAAVDSRPRGERNGGAGIVMSV
jgi:hypothetical protein